MAKENRYVLGMVDYARSGKANCEAAITWSLKDGRFSMCAEIWNSRKTDILCGGQCVAEVAARFPSDAKAQRMLAIWKEWHLNDMKAGSPAQAAFLKSFPERQHYEDGFGSHFEWALAKLTEAGINPDPGFLHNGKPYSYGSAWLKVELPSEVEAEIKSWG